MHRAVAARLANPDISLFQALRKGGFDYPTNDDASVTDSEKVTLGQRKNQLSRRLRLARKQNGLDGQEGDLDGSDSLNGLASQRESNASASSLSMEAQKELQKLMQHSRTSNMNATTNLGARALQMKREYSELGGLSDDEVDPDPPTMEVQQEEQPKHQRIAKFHPDYAPLFVPPAASVRHSFSNTSSTNSTVHKGNTPVQSNFQKQPPPTNFAPAPNSAANGFSAGFGAATATFPQASLFTQQINNPFTTQQSQHPRASAVAMSSLTHSAQVAGLTLEQLAMALASNTSTLAKILTETNNGGTFSKQQDLALHLYETESKALYSKCMLLSGMDPRLCQPNSPAHLQFALKAWQTEGKRLHDLMGEPRGIGEPPGLFENGETVDKSDGKSASPGIHGPENGHNHGHDNHDHNHAHADLEGCEATHVHRLDGQCGHKAIIHQPKDGSAHIDFVIGNRVECYHGIEPLGKKFDSVWPSRYKCKDYDENCSEKCAKKCMRITETLKQAEASNAEPKIIQLSDINLQDPEWNYDVNGSIDGGVMGLFKLGGELLSESALSTPSLDPVTFHE
jgi:hypothetical protein